MENVHFYTFHLVLILEVCIFAPMKRAKRVTPISKAESGEEILSRRERQIMDTIYAMGSATAREIWERLSDPPTYATVRTILRVLLEKQRLTYRKDGRAYVYTPVRSRDEVAQSAMKRMLRTFYDGSLEQAVSSMLGIKDKKLDLAELERIEAIVKQAKRKAKKS